MNSVCLIGRLGSDPEVKYFESGKVTCQIKLAVNRTKDETDWFIVKAWDKTAELISSYCRKGDQVGIDGRLEQEKWETKEGEKRSAVVIVANRVTLLGSKGGSGQTPQTSSPAPTPSMPSDFDDIPF